MITKFPSAYSAIEAAVENYGLPRGAGAPFAQAARLVLDGEGNVNLPLVCARRTIKLAQMQAIGAATSGDITSGIVLPKSAVIFGAVAKTTTAIDGGRASGTLTSDNTNVSDGDTVTIGTKVYTFKTALTPTEGQVLIGGSADASLLNLIRAINHSGTPNTDYKCAAANADVTADTAVTSHAFAVHAIVAGSAGNSIASTEVAAHLSWGAATLSAGLTSISAAVGNIKTSITSQVTANTYDLLAAVSVTNFQGFAPTAPAVQNIGATTSVLFHLALTGDNADAITAGEVDIYVFYSALPL